MKKNGSMLQEGQNLHDRSSFNADEISSGERSKTVQ